MSRRTPGLYKRWSKAQQAYVWEIDKQIGGERLRLSTATTDLEEANRRLAFEVERARQRQVYGVRDAITFDEAAGKYLDEYGHKRSIDRDVRGLDPFMPYIGHLPLQRVHQGTLQPAIDARRASVSNGTINRDLAAVRIVLSLSARVWRYENGDPWLGAVPKLPMLPETSKRKPYPLTWDEQALLFRFLPANLERMALFAINTGMRDQEVCGLKWSWLETIDGHSVFVLPDSATKTGDPRIVVCNRVAGSVVASQRGLSDTWVFPSTRRKKGQKQPGPVHRINNHGWRTARRKAAAAYEKEIGGKCPWGFANLRVHDLRHTFGRRLRAAGVSEEDRKDLLGHRSQSMTTHYSAAEIHQLIQAANTVCDGKSRPMLRVVG